MLETYMLELHVTLTKKNMGLIRYDLFGVNSHWTFYHIIILQLLFYEALEYCAS